MAGVPTDSFNCLQLNFELSKSRAGSPLNPQKSSRKTHPLSESIYRLLSYGLVGSSGPMTSPHLLASVRLFVRLSSLSTGALCLVLILAASGDAFAKPTTCSER